MTVPLDPDKIDRPALISAGAFLADLRRRGLRLPAPPPLVLLCLQEDVRAAAVKKQRGRRVAGFPGQVHWPGRQSRAGTAGGFGIGAPAAAAQVELLAAWGVAEIILVGLAGGLQPGQSPGDLILVERALRDEGTSQHYLPPGRDVAADGSLTARVGEQLAAAGHPFAAGPVWTTDAPFRETAAEVARLSEEGVQAVDMEAAAVLAVAHRRGVAAAAVLAVGDRLAGGVWRPGGQAEGVRALVDVVRTLSVPSAPAGGGA